jgi:hypothetical protein
MHRNAFVEHHSLAQLHTILTPSILPYGALTWFGRQYTGSCSDMGSILVLKILVKNSFLVKMLFDLLHEFILYLSYVELYQVKKPLLPHNY